MKNLIKITATLLLLSGSLLALEWAKDLETAFATAQKEHKNVMVLVEGSYCGWCSKMKNQTLGDPAIEKRLEKYIVVKVMREDKATIAKLPSVYGVPTTFFMGEDRGVLEDVVGYFNPQDFTSFIDDIEAKIKAK